MKKYPLLRAEELLEKMRSDEYNAPDEYEEIIKLLPINLARKLKKNQSDERRHYRTVVSVIKSVEKMIEEMK